jgi:surface protein
MAFSKANGILYYDIANANGVVADGNNLASVQSLCLKNGIQYPGFSVKIDTTLGDGLAQIDVNGLWANLTGPTKNWRIFWGDGSSDTIVYTTTVPTHSYSSAGQYDVTVVGTPNALYNWGSANDKNKLISIERWAKNFKGGQFESSTSLVSDNAPDIPNVTTLPTFFNGCTSLTTIGDWGSIVWQPAAQDMYFVFASCTVFNFDISNWQVGNATNFANMFRGTQAFNQNIGAWDMGSAEDIAQMFRDATAFNNGGVGGIGVGLDSWTFGTKLTNTSFLFEGATAFNQTIDSWDMSSVINIANMFQNCSAFNKDLNSWNLSPDLATGTSTSVVTNKLVDSTANFVSAEVDNFYSRILNVTTGVFADITAHTATELTLNADIFTATGESYRVFNILGMTNLFANATSFNGNISSWNTIGATSFKGLFNNSISFNQDIGGWDTRRVTNMNSAFIQASAFNKNLNGWDWSNVTDMFYCFRTASAFNNGGVTTNWDLGEVQDMQACFFGNTSLSVDINSFNPSKCTNFIQAFLGCGSLNSNFSGWTFTTSADIDCNQMFYLCTALIGTGMSGWTTNRVTKMQDMFVQTSFNQDISLWNISSLLNASNMLNNTSFTTTNYDLLLDSTTGWASQATIQSAVSFGVGGTQFTLGGNAEAGHNYLTGTKGWNITDGGGV